MNRLFLAYGTLLLLLFSYAGFRGWSMTGFDEVRDVPQSVRDNPGTYRSHYVRYFRK